ncbi:sodium:solute symporter family protein [Halomonas daqingensis]|uniref:Sodium:solute symporter family protein n=1 Tax=Billgrantia desiderata TaxID=52021 RepID=A0ABS9B794_9GAMM|nr:sodium:solute symporter family protein [Halomonas desiderata]MCE8043497.1 sodium:solute symporter family protein [Halomonas desiderata]MCE8048071.1 sodium:solute symporter family protein [Halomonas desiderata]
MSWYLTYTVAYFLFMFAIGAYYFTKVKTSDAYLIAGWNMGYWSITGTIISTWCGAAVFIGWVGMGFSVGMSGYFKFALPGILVSMLLIYFFSKPLRRQRLYTLADLFSERFGKRAGVFPSIFSAFVYSVPTTALQIVGMSTIFNIVFGTPIGYGIALSFALILGFTILGGLVATIVTDAMQSIVVISGIIVLAIAAIIFGGGFSEIMKNTPQEYLAPLGEKGMGDVLVFALTVAPFYLVWQSTWQRIFASRTEEVAIKAGLTGFGIVLAISLLPYMIGVIARQFVPLDMRPDLIFSYVTVELLHPAIGGIVIVGLLSALMTGADSFILQGSSNLAQDFYHRLINPSASEKQKMVVARLSVVIISLLAVMVAYLMTDIIAMYQWALRLSATTLVIPFLAVMFWRRATSMGCFLSMALAAGTTILWPTLGTSIDPVFPGFLVSLCTLVSISFMTSHAGDESVKAVYWEDLPSAESRQGKESSTPHVTAKEQLQ